MRRRTLLPALLALTACVSGAQTMPTALIPTQSTDLALLQQAVTQHSGRALLGDITGVQVYALPDGARIGCGSWIAPDPYGTYGGRAPFYVRYSGSVIERVHLDDLTGYGPARTGCLSASSRLTVSAG